MTEPIRRCSMSSYMSGPWRCGTWDCPRDERCKANVYNAQERAWVERELARPERQWEDAWLRHCGLPVRPIDIEAAREALRDVCRSAMEDRGHLRGYGTLIELGA